jgi:sugar phosphate isomerase/epimerase
MLREAREIGFRVVELGYDLRGDLVPGVRSALETGEITVASVHAFCPVPAGCPQGHPELFSIADPDQGAREIAVRHTVDSIRFAAAVGAQTVVSHAGRVDIGDLTSDLIALAEAGRQYSARFDRLKVKLVLRREKKVAPHLDALGASIEKLLPCLESSGVNLAFENLPSLEALPSETELAELLDRFNSPRIGYWHDTGHAIVRQRLGFASQRHTLNRFQGRTMGMHVHSVEGFAGDHMMPPRGELDTAALKPFVGETTLVVLEPAPGTPPQDLAAAAACLRDRIGDGGAV